MGRSFHDSETARRLFDYNKETGEFRRKVSVSSRALAGMSPGCIDSHGYLVIRFNGKTEKAHRLAWLYVHGEWPELPIDHLNGIRSDNRISNLRLSDATGNMENRRSAHKNNRSCGLLGVTFDKQHRKYRAQIQVNRKHKYLGLFLSAEEAHAVYLKAKAELHPFQTIVEK